MSNQIILTAVQSGEHYRVEAGAGQALRVPSAANAYFRLADAATGIAPENLVLERVEDSLYIRTEGSEAAKPDMIIEDYYKYDGGRYGNRLTGMQANGQPYRYPVETADKPVLAEQVAAAGPSSAGSGALLKVLGGIAGAGILGGLAGGGSGGGSDSTAGAAAVKTSVQPEAVAKVEQAAAAATVKSFPSESSGHAGANPAEPEEKQPSKTSADSGTEQSEAKFADARPESGKTGGTEAGMPEAPAPESTEPEAGVKAKEETAGSLENTVSEPLPPSVADEKEGPAAEDAAAAGRLSDSGTYYIYEHPVYGRYVDAREFGTDTSGKTDSLAAINAALAAAHTENAAVYLSGNLYIADQIVLNRNHSGVTGLFGDGMGKTTISFDKAQTGVFNPNTNHDDIRPFAGILIDGQSGKTIAELSVKYTNKDFYRPGESYFGKVSGILVNDADNTLVSKVEVSGANRAGVFFTSTQALQKDPNGGGKTYKARVAGGEVDETYEALPLGENNRVVDSHMHHNRVAGVLFAYQKDFTADGNLLAWNGHEADGGTGYGISAMAGSYNYGMTFTNNTTDHNYRKGLDVHDGNGVLIANNTLVGDRLYGVGVYNRQFSMDTVKITDNTIVQDPNFRLETDDNPRLTYHGYSAIQLQTNTQYKNLHSAEYGRFDISGNTIKNLTLYKNNIQTYAVEFRNHEQQMDYTLDINDNIIEGASTKYLIAIINNTKDQAAGTNGPGSGTINITGNKADIGTIAAAAMPIYIEEKNTDGGLRGKVTLEGNHIKVRENSDGSIEAVQVIGNAEQYNISGNTFELHGKMDKAMVSIHGRSSGEVPELNVIGNDIITDRTAPIYRGWLEYRNADVLAEGNTHNGSDVAVVKSNTAPAVKAAVLNLDIGADTVSGYAAGEMSGKAAPVKLPAALVKTAAGHTDDDSGALPALNDLLDTAVVDLSGILGKAGGAGLAGNTVIPEYASLPDSHNEQWQSEAPAYIV